MADFGHKYREGFGKRAAHPTNFSGSTPDWEDILFAVNFPIQGAWETFSEM